MKMIPKKKIKIDNDVKGVFYRLSPIILDREDPILLYCDI